MQAVKRFQSAPRNERGSITLTSEVLAFTVIAMIAFVSYELMYRASCQASNTANTAAMLQCDSVLDCVRDENLSGSSSSSASSSSTSSSSGTNVKYTKYNARWVKLDDTDYAVKLDTDRYAVNKYATAIKYDDYVIKEKVDTRTFTEQSDACNLLSAWYDSNDNSSSSTSTSSSSSGDAVQAKQQVVEQLFLYEQALTE